jgi:hypothetical protein
MVKLVEDFEYIYSAYKSDYKVRGLTKKDISRISSVIWGRSRVVR